MAAADIPAVFFEHVSSRCFLLPYAFAAEWPPDEKHRDMLWQPLKVTNALKPFFLSLCIFLL